MPRRSRETAKAGPESRPRTSYPPPPRLRRGPAEIRSCCSRTKADGSPSPVLVQSGSSRRSVPRNECADPAETATAFPPDVPPGRGVTSSVSRASERGLPPRRTFGRGTSSAVMAPSFFSSRTSSLTCLGNHHSGLTAACRSCHRSGRRESRLRIQSREWRSRVCSARTGDPGSPLS